MWEVVNEGVFRLSGSERERRGGKEKEREREKLMSESAPLMKIYKDAREINAECRRDKEAINYILRYGMAQQNVPLL